MTTADLKAHLRLVECIHDVPPQVRSQWVQQALQTTTNPAHRVHLLAALRRLKVASKRAKHEVFYSIDPLLRRAFQHPDPPALQATDVLLDTLLMQIRLTTLLRSVDAANISWAIF